MADKRDRPLLPEKAARSGVQVQRLYHGIPETDRVFPNEFVVFDNDLAVENLENDVPEADLQ